MGGAAGAELRWIADAKTQAADRPRMIVLRVNFFFIISVRDGPLFRQRTCESGSYDCSEAFAVGYGANSKWPSSQLCRHRTGVKLPTGLTARIGKWTRKPGLSRRLAEHIAIDVT